MLRNLTTALVSVSAVLLAGSKSAPENCWQSFACALGLSVSISVAAHAQIGLAGASDADWTVLTIAQDGAWGTGTDMFPNRAIATAIARCRAMSTQTLGCGAYSVTVQRRWALGLRCGKENILATGATLAEVMEGARRRELELRTIYQPEMGSCGTMVVVAPDGSVTVPLHQAVASDSNPR